MPFFSVVSLGKEKRKILESLTSRERSQYLPEGRSLLLFLVPTATEREGGGGMSSCTIVVTPHDFERRIYKKD